MRIHPYFRMLNKLGFLLRGHAYGGDAAEVRVAACEYLDSLYLRLSLAGAMPDVADRDSHGRLNILTAVQLRVPPGPPFVMWIVSVRATFDPTFAESVMAPGVTLITGCCNRRITGTSLVVPL